MSGKPHWHLLKTQGGFFWFCFLWWYQIGWREKTSSFVKLLSVIGWGRVSCSHSTQHLLFCQCRKVCFYQNSFNVPRSVYIARCADARRAFSFFGAATVVGLRRQSFGCLNWTQNITISRVKVGTELWQLPKRKLHGRFNLPQFPKQVITVMVPVGKYVWVYAMWVESKKLHGVV